MIEDMSIIRRKEEARIILSTAIAIYESPGCLGEIIFSSSKDNIKVQRSHYNIAGYEHSYYERHKQGLYHIKIDLADLGVLNIITGLCSREAIYLINSGLVSCVIKKESSCSQNGKTSTCYYIHLSNILV